MSHAPRMFTHPPESLTVSLASLRVYVAEIPEASRGEPLRVAVAHAEQGLADYQRTRHPAHGSEARRLVQLAKAIARSYALRAVAAGELEELPYDGPALPPPSPEVAAALRAELARASRDLQARVTESQAGGVFTSIERAEIEISRYERRKASEAVARAEVQIAGAMVRARLARVA